MELPLAIRAPQDPSSEVLVVDCGGQRAWWWFAADHQLALAAPSLTATWRGDGDRLRATITTDVLVRDLTIYPDRLEAGATIDCQLISLLPGERCDVSFRGLGTADPEQLLSKPYCWSAAL